MCMSHFFNRYAACISQTLMVVYKYIFLCYIYISIESYNKAFNAIFIEMSLTFWGWVRLYIRFLQAEIIKKGLRGSELNFVRHFIILEISIEFLKHFDRKERRNLVKITNYFLFSNCRTNFLFDQLKNRDCRSFHHFYLHKNKFFPEKNVKFISIF